MNNKEKYEEYVIELEDGAKLIINKPIQYPVIKTSN